MKKIILLLVAIISVALTSNGQIYLQKGSANSVIVNNQTYPRGYLLSVYNWTDSTLKIVNAANYTKLTQPFGYNQIYNNGKAFASMADVKSWMDSFFECSGTTDLVAASNNFRLVSAASTNLRTVHSGTANITHITVNSIENQVVYLKLYDAVDSSTITVGLSTPKYTITIPKGAGYDVDFGRGIYFTNGIVCAITGSITDEDITPIAAKQVYLNILSR